MADLKERDIEETGTLGLSEGEWVKVGESEEDREIGDAYSSSFLWTSSSEEAEAEGEGGECEMR